ncbi:hypothetical protein HSBAA_11540 [Vreelandella sulfidaeris]|uniref:Uncharacterized protein n=1 Tax=Vreelandella sulfidaeris TaxID=115553 RepID=A0A455U6F8_9GAMM|nr:hypothetical protein HSBAA_11540 [Halomonas sulfidaeris]
MTRALLEGDVQDYLRFHISEGEPNFKNPLENVSSKDLIDWCINSGDEKAWKLIAGIIAPFDSTQDDKACKLSEQALAILNAAPNSVEVLDIYVDAVSPMSCSGNSANIMARRILALKELESSELEGLAEHLRNVLTRLKRDEAEERAREANRDREREQRFE